MSRTMMVRLGVLAAVLAGRVQAAELNTLRDLKVTARDSKTEIAVTGTRAPTFTVFRLSEPERLVVDVSSADATAIKGHHDGAGAVSGVVASQFSDDKSSVGRLLIPLDKGARYDVRGVGNQVVIAIQGTASASATPAAPVQAEQAAASPTAKAEAAGVVASRTDEQPVAKPATRVTRLAMKGDVLSISTDGEVAKYELLELSSPARLAIDLHGVTSSVKAPKLQSGLVREVRVGTHEGKVRLVVDSRGEMPIYRVARTRDGVKVALSPSTGASPAMAAAKSPAANEAADGEAVVEIDGKRMEVAARETAPLLTKPSEPARAGVVAEVKDLSFDEAPNGGMIDLKLTGESAWKVERPDPRTAVLLLQSARLPKRLERSLDTSDLETPVKMISAFAVPGAGERVRVVVVGDGALSESVVKTPNGLAWRLSVNGAKTEEVSTQAKTAGFSSEAVRYAESGAPQKGYVGKKVSFEFKDIDIHNLLRIIAEVSKKNIVVADDVSGKVTIRLRNVPWDQALELILRSKGLGQENMGNIIRVAPLKTLEEETKIREERKKSAQRQEELMVQLIPVNYATADDMKSRVKDILTDRGSVTVDTRTNVLIVRDVRSSIDRARSLVQSLDTQTPQVLIESRIVEANTTFSRQLGVQWGGSAQMSPAAGNPTGLIFPNAVAVRGGAGGGNTAGTSDAPDFAINLPAAVGQGSGGALGFIFGSAGGAVALNLRISALENQGYVKTISAPKVTTLDNIAAKISQGVSIPFSQVSASGVNTSFVEARLALEVTPHITADGSVLMQIKAENNQPDPASTGANGQPAIQRKEANTQVLVKDGDTTVIGGIYVRRGANSQASVPFLGKIPVLGYLFRSHTELDNRQELLIFITPRIINRQAMTVAQ